MPSPPYHSAKPWVCPSSNRKSELRSSSTRNDNFLGALPNEFVALRGFSGMKKLVADTPPSGSPALCHHLGTTFQRSWGRDKRVASAALAASPLCSETMAVWAYSKLLSYRR